MIYDYGIYDPHSDTWLGNPATKYSKKYPKCSQCHAKTRLTTPRVMDRDGNISPATFECIQCGCEVPDPIQFMTPRESEDVLGELLFKVAKQKGLNKITSTRSEPSLHRLEAHGKKSKIK